MVKLIPDVLAPEIKSPAEKRLFIEFRDHRTNKKYVVLHSLGIAEHTNNIFGEIDFVVLCNEGVLCLEVKGGQVSRRGGVWEFTNRYGKISRKNEGPFQQVQGNMQSLRQYMVRRLGNNDPLVRCQYACAVAMPDCYFEATGVGIDVVPEILVDAKRPWNLDSLVDQAFGYWRQTCLEKHGFEGGRLTDAEIDKLANLLRGDFHFVPSMKESVERAVKELCALTAEQYEVLESLFDNPRTMVSGVAGAGKTLIAMEQARRAYWEGKSVLYLCFNHNIAQYVQYQFEKDNVFVEAVTLHAFMMRACGFDWSPDLSQHFYEKELPAAFMAIEGVPAYDLVIIDEGQDLLTDTYLECIDRIVQDGLGDGTWAIYYDPNQNIFNSYAQLDAMIKKLRREAYAMSWKLRANCRNTKQIANANILMTNIPNQGKPTVSGPQVEYDSYSGKEDERQKNQCDHPENQGQWCNWKRLCYPFALCSFKSEKRTGAYWLGQGFGHTEDHRALVESKEERC